MAALPRTETGKLQRFKLESRPPMMQILQPPGWAAPKGYANGIAARGTLVFVGGQIGWNAQQQFESDDFVAQTRAGACATSSRCCARPAPGPSTWCA